MLTTSVVTLGTNVVKLDVDDACSHHRPLSSFLELIQVVMSECRFRSLREWCQAAGVSDNYLSTYKSRLETGEVRQAKVEQVAKLADAAGVSTDWLLGRSEQRDPNTTEDEGVSIRSLVGGGRKTQEEADAILEQFDMSGALDPDQAARIELRFRTEHSKSNGAATSRRYWLNRLNRFAEEELSAPNKLTASRPSRSK